MLVPEMNTGQFKTVLRDQYLIDAKPLTKTSGQPFTIAELEERHRPLLRRSVHEGDEGGEVERRRTQLPSIKAVNP